LVTREDVTVALVLPNSLAATAEPTLSAADKAKDSGESLRRAVLTAKAEDDSSPPPRCRLVTRS